ncbi:alpha/beta hydrolase [Microbacterium sp. WCS2018Hpa-23]|uniref:alpha/beta hydrolase n=1 Tax=Microbacterium sp. WCS2018Hpa-23 TaxID=3073634 RepID=UPI00288349E1|nr:alpha/beta hydrolase [Microbacterium sp. WCS2018Hpa-23]
MNDHDRSSGPTDEEQTRVGPPAFLAPGTAERQHPHGARFHPSLTYSIPDGYRPLHLDVYVPERGLAPSPCVIWIHGGAWLFGSRQTPPDHWPEGLVFQSAIDAGLAVVSIDYRHSREAPFPAQLHDAKAAVRYVRRFAEDLGIDPDRIGAWGESAGGHLAALLGLVDDPALEGTEGVTGTSSAVTAVVDFYGVSDVDTMPSILDSLPAEVLEVLVGAGGIEHADPTTVILANSPLPSADARRLLSPVNHAHPTPPPFLLVHGDEDTLVPLSQSEQLLTALLSAGGEADLIPVAGAAHVFEGTDPAPSIRHAVDFLRSRLTSGTTPTAS